MPDADDVSNRDLQSEGDRGSGYAGIGGTSASGVSSSERQLGGTGMTDSARGGRSGQGADRAGTTQDSARDVSVVDERGTGKPRSTSTRGGGSRSNRGFASMDPAKQKEIASKGGRAAHEKGTAHEFDSSEARAAGRKGGEVVSRNREHMAEIGRRGGESRGANRSATQRGGNQPRREGNESRSGEQ